MTRGRGSSVTVVGALVPPALLGRLTAAPAELSGLSGQDYHLPLGETPREAANRAWASLRGAWAGFRRRLDAEPEGSAALSLTREGWLHHLMHELGYGRLQTTPGGGIDVDGRVYPVSHLWQNTPIHLMGWGVELDRRRSGVIGAAERAPHALVQELLNRSDEHLWGIVTNGRVLRLLRDSTNLSVQSYVEFDLEAMFDGELFSDFVLLYLMAHQSRVEVRHEGGTPSDCWLETWRTEAIATGTRAMELLRDGVQRAIEELGGGFLASTPQLRERFRANEVSKEAYHAALLQLVYRLLFLFVAEDRDALLSPAASAQTRERYEDYYSTARLRRRARRLGTRHTDAWQTLQVVIAGLGREEGCRELGLPGLGGLFEPVAGDPLAGAEIANSALFAAIRHLSVVQPKGQRPQPVDYRNLGAEELGSIYESLLELVPDVDVDALTLRLQSLAGNDRKTTGSYYTPSALIDLVLDETLDPLLDDAQKAADPEAVLLAMTVCDPACGSGHFLVAAARRMAERLAVVRSEAIDPTPELLHEALAEVIERCIYGVDLNPMAAQLAKVSLWLESMRAGRPLTFLDAHIKVGNALLGTTPALVRDGVPDAAFTALVGDDKKVVTELKKINKRERAGASSLFSPDAAYDDLDSLRQAYRDLSGVEVRTLAHLHRVQRRFAELESSEAMAREKLAADTWCAAFVAERTSERAALTTDAVRAAEAGLLDEERTERVRALGAQYRFFHWHLEFPDVFEVSAETLGEPNGWRGGFTAMVGNPPWERVKLQEKEFFASRDVEVANAANSAARKKLIAALDEKDKPLAEAWKAAQRMSEGTSALLRLSGRYPLCGVGDVNTYSVFAEHFRSSIAPEGRMGIITPTELATGATTARFFADSVKKKRLAAFYDFENEAKIFPGVHNQFRFAVTTMTGGAPVAKARLAFYTRYIEDTPARRLTLAAEEILRLNPNTGTLPIFRTRRDADLTLSIYRRHPVLVDDRAGLNAWGLTFATLFHMANDSGLFRTDTVLEDQGASFDGWAWQKGSRRWVPLYESKMLAHYDHRYATYDGATQAQLNKGTLPRLTEAQHQDPFVEPLTRYWVDETEVEKAIGDRWDRGWFLGWRDITNASNERTFIPSVLPRTSIGHPFPLAFLSRTQQAPLLQAALSSLVLDFVSRQKISGTHMTYSYVQQLAVPAPENFDVGAPGISAGPLGDWVRARVLELTYTSHRLAPYARDVLGIPESASPGGPFRWD